MKIKELIGQKITDIQVWSNLEVGGLDVAEVYIKLNNGKTIRIPWSFDAENIEQDIPENAKSVFSDLSDIQIRHINKEGKSVQEIIEAKKKRENSCFGRIRSFFGIVELVPREYKTYKMTHKENKRKYLKDQKITDFLMFEGFDSVGFLELENGYIITERTVVPHGVGGAGLEYYENIHDFEQRHGNEYLRFTKDATNDSLLSMPLES